MMTGNMNYETSPENREQRTWIMIQEKLQNFHKRSCKWGRNMIQGTRSKKLKCDSGMAEDIVFENP